MSLTGTEYITLSRKVMKSKVSPNAKILYINLLLRSGSADFYIDDISEILDCSYRSSISFVRELLDEGLIYRDRNFGSASHYEVVKE